MQAPECTVFDSYKSKVSSFFENTANYERLVQINEREEDEDIYGIIVFFLKEYNKNEVVKTTGGGFYNMRDEYRNAVACHKKRYYDFGSRAGKGELEYKGRTNPPVRIECASGALSLPLPRLVAVWWFIQFGFDQIMWNNYEDVVARYTQANDKTKRRYMEAHKRRKFEIRRISKQKASKKLTAMEKRAVSLMLKRRHPKPAKTATKKSHHLILQKAGKLDITPK